MAPNSHIFKCERLSHKDVMGVGRQYGTNDIAKKQARITKLLKKRGFSVTCGF
jgi:hypothetical protein